MYVVLPAVLALLALAATCRARRAGRRRRAVGRGSAGRRALAQSAGRRPALAPDAARRRRRRRRRAVFMLAWTWSRALPSARSRGRPGAGGGAGRRQLVGPLLALRLGCRPARGADRGRPTYRARRHGAHAAHRRLAAAGGGGGVGRGRRPAPRRPRCRCRAGRPRRAAGAALDDVGGRVPAPAVCGWRRRRWPWAPRPAARRRVPSTALPPRSASASAAAAEVRAQATQARVSGAVIALVTDRRSARRRRPPTRERPRSCSAPRPASSCSRPGLGLDALGAVWMAPPHRGGRRDGVFLGDWRGPPSSPAGSTAPAAARRASIAATRRSGQRRRADRRRSVGGALRRLARPSPPDPVAARARPRRVPPPRRRRAVVPLPVGARRPPVSPVMWWLPRIEAAAPSAAVPARLEAELPDVVDLLVLAVGAGLTVPLALDAVARRATGALAAELGRVVAATRQGHRLADALDALPARRRSRAAAGGRARRVRALRRAARRRPRAARRRSAGHAAGAAPTKRPGGCSVKLLFPLVLCILPAFALLTVAPLIASALKSLRL